MVVVCVEDYLLVSSMLTLTPVTDQRTSKACWYSDSLVLESS